jgi:hypothetical protein
MAVKFGDVKGSAKKGIDNLYKFVDGTNEFRLVGDVLPRYVYWIKGTGGKDIPFECLAFSREAEKFTNEEQDYVREFYPELKCSWSYVAHAIATVDGDKKIVVVNLKKKLFQQIITLAEDLGDPTDVDTGWDIVFKKEKTGPLAFNVEYTLQQMKCKKRPLTEGEKALLADMKTLEEVLPRPTPEAQKALLEKIASGDDIGGEEAKATPTATDDLPQ